MIEDFLPQFHIRRSKALDASGEMEAALRELLLRNGVKPAAESLGQLVEKARTLKASPQLSKALLTNLREKLDQCELLVALRNDIVHSRIHAMVSGDVRSACFIHTQPRGAYGSHARVLTIDELDAFISDVKHTAAELRAVKVSPASLPRPPKPGAAGDP